MANKKLGPGQSQLGHSPFGKEKLEGPKKHHDNHGKSDSVPGKGSGMAIPGEHWEKQYSVSSVRDTDRRAGKEFNPMLAKNRPCTHTKVNEQDH